MIVTSYGNNSSSKGMLIILGTAFNEREDESLASFKETLRINKELDLTLIDLTDQNYDKNLLQNSIDNYFAKTHSVKTVVLGMHGSQAFPYSDHYSIIGPRASKSFLNEFIDKNILYFAYAWANGNIIKTSNALEMVGLSAKQHNFAGENLNVWQFSCQGSKLLSAANKYLPTGTSYVAESMGFYNSKIFINTIIQTLTENKEFGFTKLYQTYLAMNHQMKFYNSAKSADPFNIKIGSHTDTTTSIQKLDRLVGEFRQKTIDKSKLNDAISKSCKLISDTQVKFSWHGYQRDNLDVDSCFNVSTKQYDKFVTEDNKLNFSNCLQNFDHGHYLGTYLYQASYLGKASYPQDCLLSKISNVNINGSYPYIGGMEKFSLIAELYYSADQT